MDVQKPIVRSAEDKYWVKNTGKGNNQDSTSNKFCQHFHPRGMMVVVERA
jgi:hypothetical protein